ncbi:MAG TPA: Holliday junction resolvase RuvX [Candidatus Peribacter riflensis]|uniref:Putative pre-16S rRNA nuclease n=1 Tax=Candidatus Peribacter riflensis TaxID=1735162 RepID=A0A0S1SUJ4_9BACT|nr:MAG: putative holliday junction resolvase [Candidatus Peribacter riflensis]OGJ79248.1 MAG: hypothetical protein A2398_00320 [Candidatus Peribacteria bacterium RIFOXYB1_FULL_57_12]OGJ82534.1 MAG: hypothetical protein A2412_02950 [Candidatus Peribacteria bacterium RIFOXYC1_FULL_58_8]ALM10919.1 MAG: putative holliday junction resolvase [Candidatus Peribacter riflensis]ALM12022.1 MAG: putative holliday junction resolvase [Candidatus Peribacter riflensis]
MARLLALDIGTKRTGVAYLDDAVGVPLPLDTLQHRSTAALVAQLEQLIRARSIDQLIIGLPLLPSGEEGSQARLVRSVAAEIGSLGLPILLKDERYTTPRGPQSDPDAIAALNLLSTVIPKHQEDC